MTVQERIIADPAHPEFVEGHVSPARGTVRQARGGDNGSSLPPLVQATFTHRVMGGLIWRSGSQVLAQLVTWGATFLVIRLLTPADYGVFAMTQSVLVLLGMLSGQSFASALVRVPELTPRHVRQVLGLLILLNGGLALLQVAAAPLVAAYYRQPLVTELLRVQALLYLANPAIALGGALLSRELDYRRQALTNIVAAIVCAGVGLTGALSGWGVWTLVLAPIAMFWVRGLGFALGARLTMAPSFDFTGCGETVRFGLAMLASSLFWFVQTQADVFIGGRLLGASALGLYTTSLFLATILTAKFVPPMNEIAYSAYARLQHDRAGVAAAFLKSVRLVMLVALPFYFGMAATAEPLVRTVLGAQWAGTAPIVRLLALAMPCVTLQILFAPVTNALGRPRLAVWGAGAGALVMPLGFAIGVSLDGRIGLAWAWLAAFPLLMLFTAAISLRPIGVRWREIAAAVRPPLAAAAGMAALVLATDRLLPPLAPLPRLALLVSVGTLAYGAFALTVARHQLAELLRLVRRR